MADFGDYRKLISGGAGIRRWVFLLRTNIYRGAEECGFAGATILIQRVLAFRGPYWSLYHIHLSATASEC